MYQALQSKALGLGLSFIYVFNKHFYGTYMQQTLFQMLHKNEFNKLCNTIIILYFHYYSLLLILQMRKPRHWEVK